jgi:hypothetical protein
MPGPPTFCRASSSFHDVSFLHQQAASLRVSAPAAEGQNILHGLEIK